MVGLPKCVQSDQGSNFTSKVFGQVMEQLGVQCVNYKAYRPQSQGALECIHQTLNTMMRVYCCEVEEDWDEVILRVLLSLYINQSLQVRWGNICSDSFSVQNGVKQGGGIILYIVFSIY